MLSSHEWALARGPPSNIRPRRSRSRARADHALLPLLTSAGRALPCTAVAPMIAARTELPLSPSFGRLPSLLSLEAEHEIRAARAVALERVRKPRAKCTEVVRQFDQQQFQRKRRAKPDPQVVEESRRAMRKEQARVRQAARELQVSWEHCPELCPHSHEYEVIRASKGRDIVSLDSAKSELS